VGKRSTYVTFQEQFPDSRQTRVRNRKTEDGNQAAVSSDGKFIYGSECELAIFVSGRSKGLP
jgi:hypothetical protein